MKTLIDSSVIVASAISIHPLHPPCLHLMQRAREERGGFAVSQHGLGEVYSVLTRLPEPMRILPALASQLVHELVEILEVVPLVPTDYLEAVSRLSAAGMAGRILFDMLHVIAAENAGCARILTDNERDFGRLPARKQLTITGPESLQI